MKTLINTEGIVILVSAAEFAELKQWKGKGADVCSCTDVQNKQHAIDYNTNKIFFI